MSLKIHFLGTGTSNGIPMLGCSCPVCLSKDPKNQRLRSSILIQNGPTRIVVDTGPDFRTQALRAGIINLTGVLYTHHHADHLHGIDDLRPFSYKGSVPIWAPAFVIAEIRNRFGYFFETGFKGTSTPKVHLQEIWDKPVKIQGIGIQPIPIFHGPQEILGYRIGDLAYLTDCSGLPDSSRTLMNGVKTLIVGALREHPHPTHFTVQEAIEFSHSIQAQRTYLTHISHDIDHTELQNRLPEEVYLAYDGLIIEE
jgi:phosphoribosyl 1,2-cyclic phosphate phosphodiesterase